MSKKGMGTKPRSIPMARIQRRKMPPAICMETAICKVASAIRNPMTMAKMATMRSRVRNRQRRAWCMKETCDWAAEKKRSSAANTQIINPWSCVIEERNARIAGNGVLILRYPRFTRIIMQRVNKPLQWINMKPTEQQSVCLVSMQRVWKRRQHTLQFF